MRFLWRLGLGFSHFRSKAAPPRPKTVHTSRAFTGGFASLFENATEILHDVGENNKAQPGEAITYLATEQLRLAERRCIEYAYEPRWRNQREAA